MKRRKISTEGARALRMGINLGRLIAVDVACSVEASEPHASWRLVEPYRGLHRRAYWRAIERASDAEGRRIIDEWVESSGILGKDTA